MTKPGRPKGTGGVARELSTDEIKRISYCFAETRHEKRNRAIFFLCLGCAVRIGEACGLRIGDVAPNGQLEESFTLEKHSTKSKRSRTIPLVYKDTIKALAEYLDERFQGEPWEPDQPLFPSQKDPRQPVLPNSMIKTFAKVFKLAKVSDVSTHSMRRSCANQLRRQGIDLYIIQKILGHSSVATTQKYFASGDVEVANAMKGLKF